MNIPKRRCPLPGCGRSLDHLAPQARWCSNACKQAGYRFRRDGGELDDHTPTGVFVSPATTSAEELEPGRWRVSFDDESAPAVVTAGSEGQARAAARWSRAKPVQTQGDQAG